MNTPTNQLSKEDANELFIYKDNDLYWKIPTGRRHASKPAGCISKSNKYRIVSINHKQYQVHNIIYNYHHGFIKRGFSVDHIDRNHLNNDIKNMRIATPRTQALNRNSTNPTPGVTFRKDSQRWRSVICVNGVRINLGSFKTLDEAVHSRTKANKHYN